MPAASPVATDAWRFCVIRCRDREGTCPLTRAHLPPSACPLWRFLQTSNGPSVSRTTPIAYSVEMHLALRQADPAFDSGPLD